MKKITFLLTLMLLTLGIGNAWGAEQTVKWTATSGALGNGIGSGTIKTGTYAWNYTRTLISGTSYTGWSSSCIQLGKNGGVENITFTTSAIPGTIKSVAVECSSYNNAHKVSIAVGGTTYLAATATAKWTTVGTKTGTGSSTGTINISFTGGTRALYIKSITVVYEETSSGGDEPVASLSAAPTTIDFGTVYEGATVADKTVAVNFANLTGAVTYSGLSTPFSATGAISATGDKITISADASTIGEYSQTLTVASTADSKTAEVTVKMNVVEKPAPTGTFTLHTGELIEGDYVIVSTNSLKAEVNSDRLASLPVTISNDEIVDPDATTIWHIAKSGEYWTLYNANKAKYAASTGAKNKAALLGDATDDKALWSVTGTSTYEFVNKKNTANSVNANLRYNSGNAENSRWACYSTSTGAALSLYRKAGAKYDVTVNSTTNGTVTADPTSAEAGTTITLTVTPAGGYVLDALTVTDASSNPVTVTDNKFTMPASDVTVTATFKANEKPAATLTLSKNGVEETFPGSWKQDDVVTLPSITSDCVKEFVGWSANPTCNEAPEYAAGDSYTLAATAQTLYAVYATAGAGETLTITPSAVSGSADPYTFTIDAAGYSLTAKKNGGSTAPTYTSNEVRVYAKGTVTLTAPKAMGTIVFNISTNGKKRLAPITASVGTIATQASGDATVTWTGDATEVTFTVGDIAEFGSENTKAGQLCFGTMTVTTAGSYSNYSTTCAAAPIATVNPTSVTATAAGAEGKVTVTYENVNTANVAVALYNDEACTETFTAGWLTASIDADKNISYTVAENTTYAERKAYIQLTAPETTGETDPDVVVIPVTQAAKDKVFASLEALLAAITPTTEGVEVTVTLTNEVIQDFYTSGSYRNGIALNVPYQGGVKVIEIYCKDVPAEWVKGGKVSGTITCPWKLYNSTWELCPTTWTELTYTAPATVKSIAVSGTPTKTTYVDGEAFDPTGLVVTATLTDDSTEPIDVALVDWTFNPETLSKGETSVSVVATYNTMASAAYEVTGLTVNDIPTKTVAEFIAAGGTRCYLEGIVSGLTEGNSMKYGNFDLTDASGTIYVYGCLNASGEKEKFAELGVKNDDKIKVIADELTVYNSKDQAKDVQYVSHISAASITVENITMEVNGVATISATVDPVDAVVTYTIKENAANAISLEGNTITALAEGTATITATVAEGATYLGNSVDFTVTVKAPEQALTEWVLTPLADITTNDLVVITMTKEETTWAMSNDNGTSAAPAAPVVTLSADALASEPAENLKWVVSNNNGTLTIYPYGGYETWLYCTNTNNGVRVGTGEAKEFTIDTDHLYTTLTNDPRYLGVYDADTDTWRCYTSINSNIEGQTLAFYVKKNANDVLPGTGEEPGDDPVVPTPTINPTATFIFNTADGLTNLGITYPATEDEDNAGSYKTEFENNATFTQDGITMTTTGGTTVATRVWLTAAGKLDLRVYKGATLTFSVPAEHQISKVVFDGSNIGHLLVNETAVSGNAWTGSAQTITFTAKSDASTIKINTIAFVVEYTRNVTNKYGSICLPYASASTSGAYFYEVVGTGTENSKPAVYLASVNTLKAGVPYIFEKTANTIKVVYSSEKEDTPQNANGLIGNFTNEYVVPANNYILYSNAFIPADGTTNKVNAYRAYLDLSAVEGGKPNQMPGRRYIGMDVQGENGTTGLDDIMTTGTPVKAIENGQLIIIRNGEKYNVQGQKL